MISNTFILEHYKLLRDRLNGCCSGACPNILAEKRDRYCTTKNRSKDHISEVFCDVCHDTFGPLADDKFDDGCPCYMRIEPKELFLELDKLIEDLEEKSKKEYSS